MNTNDTKSLPRSAVHFALAAMWITVLGSSMLACAAQTEPEPTEQSATQSEALANNGGGSTCDSRWQSCYIKCGVIYGLNDRYMQAKCEALCDEIHDECSRSQHVLGGSGGLSGSAVGVAR